MLIPADWNCKYTEYAAELANVSCFTMYFKCLTGCFYDLLNICAMYLVNFVPKLFVRYKACFKEKKPIIPILFLLPLPNVNGTQSCYGICNLKTFSIQNHCHFSILLHVLVKG